MAEPTGETFNVQAHTSAEHGPPTMFVHHANHELANWTSLTPDTDLDSALDKLGYQRQGNWYTDQHGAVTCIARRDEDPAQV